MADYLPEPLLVQILIRLPVKSILCCTAVSPSWYSLIKSPYFISTHLRFNCQNRIRNSCLLVRDCIAPKEEYYEFYRDDGCSLIKYAVHKCPFSARGSYFPTIGICNGLLLLSDEDRKHSSSLIIWNPFVHRSVCLPRPNLVVVNSRHYWKPWLGLGFDKISNDYKVVRVVHMIDEVCHAEIFRLSTNTWENISDNTISNYYYLKPRHLYLDGMVHWIGNDLKRNTVVSFDMCNERFQEMELPESLARKFDILNDMTIGMYMGSLAVSLVENSEYRIWILREYGCMESWTLQVCFEFCANLGWSFGFRENGDIQFMKAYGRWDSYDPIQLKSNLLEVRPFTDTPLLDSFRAAPYVESLVFIDKGNDCNDAATLQELARLFCDESDSEQPSESDSEQSSESDSDNDIE